MAAEVGDGWRFVAGLHVAEVVVEVVVDIGVLRCDDARCLCICWMGF